MPRLTISEFRTAFSTVLSDENDVVVLYSGIWGFGHQFGMSPTTLVDTLIDEIIDIVGTNCTLVMPSYVADFPKTRRYDLVKSKPYTGVISARFIEYPGSVRTIKPMDSYVAFGPKSDELMRLPCSTSWGNDSVLGWFEQVNARHVILGVPWHLSCAYCHRGEEALGVPYRYHKRFSGNFFNDGIPIGRCEEVMYVRPFGVNPKLDYKPTHNLLVERGMVLDSGHHDFQLQSSSSKDILSATMDLLNDDAYVFVGAADAVQNWVQNGRQQEIRDLSPAQTPPFKQWVVKAHMESYGR